MGYRLTLETVTPQDYGLISLMLARQTRPLCPPLPLPAWGKGKRPPPFRLQSKRMLEY